jgi:hypothetical protein
MSEKEYTFYTGRINERELFKKIEEEFRNVYNGDKELKKYDIYYKKDFGFLEISREMNTINLEYTIFKECSRRLEEKIRKLLEEFEIENGNKKREYNLGDPFTIASTKKGKIK